MSGESEKQIESVFIEDLGAKYAFATIKESVKQDYGITSYPSMFLITADGLVHSKGHPDERVIEQLLADVTLVPEMPAGSDYDAVRKLWDKREHARLREHLQKELQDEKLDDEARKVFTEQQAALEALAKQQLERVAGLGNGPDYLRAEQKLTRITMEWKGFEAAAAAQEQLARFQKDSKIKDEIKAGEALQKLLDKHDMSKVSQRKKLLEALPKFIKKYEGTHAAGQAQKLLTP